MTDTLPNPLEISFGSGRILVSTFTDKGGLYRGVMLRDTGETHEVGEDANLPPETINPKAGEIYIRFSSLESTKVLRDALNIVMDMWIKDQFPS